MFFHPRTASSNLEITVGEIQKATGIDLSVSQTVATSYYLHSVPDIWFMFVPAKIDHIAKITIHPKTI